LVRVLPAQIWLWLNIVVMNRYFSRVSVKVLLHEAIFPATCNTTDDDSMARQVAEYMFHAVTYLTTL